MRAALRVQVVVVGCVVALAGSMSGGATTAIADGGVPYTDPAQTGFIGLCDGAGRSVDQGNAADIPFVDTAVSSVAAEAPYDGRGRTASLYAYQPREGVTPAEWSGEALTAPSTYSNPAHPMTKGTKGDISIAQFVSDYPATWDGLVQLRLFLSAPGAPPGTTKYAATDIHVENGTWSIVKGQDVDCRSGHAQSVASVLAPRAAAGKLQPTSGPSGGASKATGPSARSAGTSSGSPPGDQVPDETSASTDGGLSAGLILGLLATAAVVTTSGLFAWRRRRGSPLNST